MPEKRRQKKIKEIVDAFFRNKYGENYRNRMHDTFTEWLSNPTESEMKDEQMLKVWDEIWADEPKGMSEEAMRLLREVERGSQPSGKGVRKKRKGVSLTQKVVRVAAAVAVLFLVGGGVWFFGSKMGREFSEEVEFVTQSGEIVDKRLADSSQVWINGMSSLTVTQNSRERVVELSGESYFKVARDEKRPFIVKAEGLTIEVLGTEFNVKAYLDSDLTVVTLEKGRVDVKTEGSEHYSLQPNQQLLYSRSTAETVVREMEQSKAGETAAWREGLLVFDSVPLEEVLKTVGRHYGVTITVTSDIDLSQLLISKFELSMDVEEMLERISLGVPNFRYKISDK